MQSIHAEDAEQGLLLVEGVGEQGDGCHGVPSGFLSRGCLSGPGPQSEGRVVAADRGITQHAGPLTQPGHRAASVGIASSWGLGQGGGHVQCQSSLSPGSLGHPCPGPSPHPQLWGHPGQPRHGLDGVPVPSDTDLLGTRLCVFYFSLTHA